MSCSMQQTPGEPSPNHRRDRLIVIGGGAGHGRTTLGAALLAVQSRHALAHPAAPGAITSRDWVPQATATCSLVAAHLSFETAGVRCRMIDPRNHTDALKFLIGCCTPDTVVLVVKPSAGMTPDGIAQLDLACALGVRNVVLFVNSFGADGDDELGRLALQEARANAERCGVEWSRITVVQGNARVALENPTDPQATRCIAELVAAVSHSDEAVSAADRPLAALVEEVIDRDELGLHVWLRVVRGTIESGMEVEVVGRLPHRPRAVVSAVMINRKPVEQGRPGDNLSCVLQGAVGGDIHKCDVVATPGFAQGRRSFEAEAYWLDRDEGGAAESFARALGEGPWFAHDLNAPRFCLHWGCEVRGMLDATAAARVGDGNTGRIEVRLDDPAVIEPGDRFSIRWRGKAIGIGVVTGGFGDR